MDHPEDSYHERLLHWIWQSLHFNQRELQTRDGRPITILDRGDLNHSDGPDFTNTRLQIGDMQWYGDLEFHWRIQDWNRHNHQHDPAFNRVILHVVYHDPADRKIERSDGTRPFTLHLRPYLPENLNELLTAFNQSEQLPCSGQLRYISREAIENQFKKAGREYFETKTDHLLNFYDPSLPPFSAWKKAFVLGLFDGLGISLNREPMLTVGRLIYKEEDDPASMSLEELREIASTLGNRQGDGAPDWNYKGCRPNNRPELRLRQASTLLWIIEQTSFRSWNTTEPEKCWQQLIEQVDTDPGIGKERSDILYGIVFLPALWLLGNLFHISHLKESAFRCWMNHDAQLPSSLFRLFAQSSIPPGLYEKQLGAVYQLKHYCKPRRCADCNVLKVLISS